MPLSRKTLWLLIGAVVLVDAITIPLVIAHSMRQRTLEGEAGKSIPQSDELPILYPVPSFSFTAQDGTLFDKAILDGKVWLADVFFTSCAGPCPVMSGNMAKISKQYTPDSGVRFVSFTVDPDTDTPAVLTAYAKRYDADHAIWTFLTGPAAKLQDLAKNGFKLGAGDTALIHSEYFVLVDRKGNVRGFFMGTNDDDVKRCKAAIDRLLKEPA